MRTTLGLEAFRDALAEGDALGSQSGLRRDRAEQPEIFSGVRLFRLTRPGDEQTGEAGATEHRNQTFRIERS